MSAKPAERAQTHVPLWLLALVTLSGTVAIHMFVPALPAAGRDLGTDAVTMRMTISVYIAGLAFGQLCYGPLADRFGRRPVLLVGLAIYGVSGAAAAFAPSVELLLWSRLAQALGGGAGIALGRAMVRDLSAPTEAARRLAALNMLIMIGPGFAPIVGAVIAEFLGWRAIFAVLAAGALAALALAWRILPETHAGLGRLDTAALARSYLALATSPVFLAIALCGGCVTTSMFAFISSAPYIVEHIGRPAHEASLYLAVLIAGVTLGAVATRRLASRYELRRLLVGSSLLCLASTFAFLALAASGHLAAPAMLVTLFFFAISAGVSSPIALTLAISVDDRVIGSASGLYGCIHMGVGAVCVWLAGFGGDPALAVALVLAGAATLAQLCLRFAYPSLGTAGQP